MAKSVDARRLGASQIVAGTTASAASTAFASTTYEIRVVASAACFVRISETTPTAVTTDSYLPANFPEYFMVTPGQKLAGITASGAASISVTEITQ